VFVHGGLGHGDVSFRFLVPLLAERFTCYCPSTRGRGHSGDHQDHRDERLAEDVRAFVDSIGEQVGVFAHSSGGLLALRAASDSAAVSSLALYEPMLPELRDDEVVARNIVGAGRIARCAAEGRLTDAAQVFFEDVALANDEELAVLAELSVADLMAPGVPVALQDMIGLLTPQASDLALLDRITAPVLLLHGSATHPFYMQVVRHLDEHLPDARSREVAGAGHLGPQLAPQPVAEELTRWFTTADALTRA
jgi:pimeloyl-ACP methyl ester carboxylesterase